jgi:RND family efflux transporter MFP subunit
LESEILKMTSEKLKGGRLPMALLLALAAFGAGCSGKPATDAAPPPVAVTVQVAQAVTIPDTSEYLATLKSRHSAAINPQVEGVVTRIFVKSGDQVAAGARLLQIDPLKEQAAVKSQEATRQVKLANLQYAQDQLDRTKKLYEAGVIPQQNLVAAQTARDAAEADLKALDAQVQQEQVQLRYYEVAAPMSGIVGDIPVHVGDRVTVATLLTTVDEPGKLEAYVYVPVERSKEVRMGEGVALVDGTGNVVASSRITFISPQVETDTQSILVKAEIGNMSRALRTSESIRARITWGTHAGPVIPVLAVQRINGQFFAFVAENGDKGEVARQRMLRVGEMVGNNFAVLEGIKPGERVIISGTQFLADGAPISESTKP